MEKLMMTMADEKQDYGFGIARLAGMGIEAQWDKGRLANAQDGEFVAQYLKDYDYTMTGGEVYNATVFAGCPNLKLVVRYGAGYENINLEDATRFGVAVINLPGANAVAVAEQAVTLMLAASRKIVAMDIMLHNGLREVASCTTHQVAGKTVGVIGCGNIGKNVIRMLSGFGCKFLVHDVVRDEAFAKQYDMRYVSLEELFAGSDIITCHTPNLPETQGLICKDTIARMKDGVLLVNTSRGAVVNSLDLIDALNSGKVRAAGLDVCEGEGLPNCRNPLMTHAKVTITPHTGAATYETYYAMMHKAIDMVEAFRKGAPLEGLLNPEYIHNKR